MGSDGLQVGLDQLGAVAGQWQGLGSRLATTTPPAAGPPFQPTTAAISGVNALISATAASFAGRIQETVTGIGTAGANYGSQEATNATDLTNVTKVTVV